jgi:hypothetical protein
MVAVNAVARFTVQSLWLEAPEFAHLPLILKPIGNGKLSNVTETNWAFLYFPWNGKLKRIRL